MNVLSLFAGAGGFELGLEACGMTTIGQVERDPYCQELLAHHWPEVPRHDDVLTFRDWWFGQSRPAVDVVCGGFPCQPFSLAGKQLGVNDERWLWPATADVIRAVRPRYVLLENVSALVRDAVAFGAVLADLHALGFDAEWATLRASDFGAPHGRERVYVLAYAQGGDGVARDRLDASGDWRPPFAVGGLRGLDVAERGQRATAWLEAEPRVDRLAYGIPAQSHRLRLAGNAVVPPVIEHLGRLIVAAEAELEAAA